MTTKPTIKKPSEKLRQERKNESKVRKERQEYPKISLAEAGKLVGSDSAGQWRL